MTSHKQTVPTSWKKKERKKEKEMGERILLQQVSLKFKLTF